MYKQKMTIEVDRPTYVKVTKDLQYGQLSSMTRKFIEGISQLMDENKSEEIFLWMYNDQPLLLNGEDDKE